MRYGELFAGVGGLSLGLDRAGFECAFHAEIEPFPRRVLAHRWPDTPLYGDVTTLDGAKLVAECGPIDLLSGGSPCQDLSVAGKRKGMTEGSGTRSSLFFEQVRLYHETNAEYLLWENVDGARSSNNGKDFACVLSALVGGTVLVPGDGWRSAGVAAGAAGIAAWRVLDAQFFGVPQRRRRVFVLCSRTGRVDPAEVLLEREGVRGDTPKGRGQRQDAPASAGNGVEGEGCVAFNPINHDGAASAYEPSSVHRSLDAIHGSKHITPVLAFSENQRAEVLTSPVVRSTGATPAVMVNISDCQPRLENVCATLQGRANSGGIGSGAQMQAVLQSVPRRLLPVECCRLMGWPDTWLDVPDENGKDPSDSVKYRACGNGVVSHQSEWVGRRLLTVTDAQSRSAA